MQKVTVIFGRTENNYSDYVEGLDGFVCASETFEELKYEVPRELSFISTACAKITTYPGTIPGRI